MLTFASLGLEGGDGESARVGEWGSGGVGEWGRVGEWESGRVGEWESGRVGEWGSGRELTGSPLPLSYFFKNSTLLLFGELLPALLGAFCRDSLK